MPTGWDFLRLKFLLKDVKDGPHYSPPYVDGPDSGYLFLSARNIKVDRWSFDDAKYISEELFQTLCRRIYPKKGDILYTKGGTTGIAKSVDFDEPFQVWVHVAVLKVIPEKVNPEYLAYVLNSPGCYAQSQLYTRGAANNDLGLTRMISIEFPWPSINEQKEIVTWLNTEIGKVDKNKIICKAQIEKLKEYRQALITEAVTGKIDLSEQRPTNPPPTALPLRPPS